MKTVGYLHWFHSEKNRWYRKKLTETTGNSTSITLLEKDIPKNAQVFYVELSGSGKFQVGTLTGGGEEVPRI